MFIVIWQFRVSLETATAFEKAYGAEGDWARLFRKSPEYVKTELFRGTDSPHTYMTLDYWTSAEAFEKFQTEHRAEYLELDRGFEVLTLEETRIGAIDG